MMRWRVLIGSFFVGAGIVCMIWFGRQRAVEHANARATSSPGPPESRVQSRHGSELPKGSTEAPRNPNPSGGGTTAVADTTPYVEADFPIAAPLNAPESTIARDLEIVSQIFEAWRSNFPREGNPVGENAEITAALMGDNRLGLALIPKGHRALNDRGELCDRWGTPFRFHQLSGSKMEVRSAGPDRKFATPDDAIWTPQ
jgi:hypothetical protein